MANLNTLFIGKVLQQFNSLESTNTSARELIAKSSPIEGTVISASFQTAGKGQIGSHWESEAGLNLLQSVILYPTFLLPRQSFELNVMLSLAVADWAAAYLEQQVRVKWPNDIMVDGQKLAGLLIHNGLQGAKIQHSILGIGINVNQTQFQGYNTPACSLCMLNNGRQFDLPLLQQNLFVAIERRYLQLRAGKLQQLQADYLEKLWRFQTEALFTRPNGQTFNGTITGINPQGKLMIRHQAGEEAFGMKEIIFS
ncbi:MAG: biotin--[acetyl-CoA-carboxylase] ligase [Saprospiraceae bacterium]|nr:biotin--[acetyl-CoA-carboxylase] ligase [Saprospiraceae bacterium]